MILIIDNYDSFVYNLARYVEELGEETLVVRNDKLSIREIEVMAPIGIIISPGPKNPEDSGICREVVEHFKGKIPLLGICLGHQTIGYVFGAGIIQGKEPVHGKLAYVRHDGKGIFKGIKIPLRVTRYHSLVIDKETLPECLEITCLTEDGVIMGIRHKEYMIEGVQFHPEAELTECGHEILGNFIKNIKRQQELE
jgi:para-aminobenzoate synthetase component 2